MFLKRFEAENWCQHRSLSWELEAGLTGILGALGAGKSNALKGIYYAITGDKGRNAGTLQANVTQGEGIRDSRTYLEFEVKGLPYSIERYVRTTGSNDRRLVMPDGTEITGSAEITEQMDLILGLGKSRAILDDFVFVDQDCTADLVKRTPTQRAELLEQLCRTYIAREARQEINKRRSAVEALINEAPSSDFVDQCEAAWQTAQAEAERLQAIASDLKAQCFTAEEMTTLVELSGLAAKWKQTQSAYEEIEAEIAKSKEELPVLIDQCNEAAAALKERIEAHVAHRPNVERARESIAKAKADLKRHNSVLDAKKKLDRAHEILRSEKSAEELREAAKDLKNRRKVAVEEAAQARIEYAELERRHALVRQGSCPTCGAKTSKLYDETQLLARMAELESLAREPGTSVIDRKLSETLASLERVQQAAATIDAVEALTTSDIVHDPDDLQVQIEEAQVLIREDDAEDESIRKETSAVSKLKSSVKVGKELYKAAVGRLKRLDLWFAEHREKLPEMRKAEQRLKQAQARQESANAAAIEAAESFASARHLRSVYEDAKKRHARSRRLSKWSEELDTLSSLFHVDALPKLVHQRALEALEEKTNDALELFEAPFVMKVADDLRLNAKFTDGTNRVQPVERLSGGQKVLWSLALRVAVHRAFANDIGLLVLDEPTSGLNEPAVLALGRLLSKLGEDFKQRKSQVLVVTHDKRLASFFHQTIEVLS